MHNFDLVGTINWYDTEWILTEIECNTCLSFWFLLNWLVARHTISTWAMYIVRQWHKTRALKHSQRRMQVYSSLLVCYARLLTFTSETVHMILDIELIGSVAHPSSLNIETRVTARILFPRVAFRYTKMALNGFCLLIESPLIHRNVYFRWKINK